MFDSRVLRKISGSKRDGAKGEWRKLHNGEVNVLYPSRNIYRVFKSIIRWAGYLACMGGEESCIQGCGEET